MTEAKRKHEGEVAHLPHIWQDTRIVSKEGTLKLQPYNFNSYFDKEMHTKACKSTTDMAVRKNNQQLASGETETMHLHVVSRPASLQQPKSICHGSGKTREELTISDYEDA